MAGSLRWYVYVDDLNNEYGVLLDETTASATELGFDPVEDGDNLVQLPRGHKMRYVNCTKMTGDAAGFLQTQFPVATLGSDAWTDQNLSFTVGGQTYAKTSRRGEAVRLVISKNTGKTGTTP